MNKFKAFFTAIAFVWLWGCGFWAFFQYLHSAEIAWLGLCLNAWALPVWMLLRYLWPRKYRGDLRESPAFAAVLTGLAVALLSDSDKGPPLYLAIYNLFVFLIYLFHLSALRHPKVPAVDSPFPALVTADGKNWSAAEHARRGGFAGLLLVFLRGSFCADSRALFAQLQALLPELRKREIGLLLFGTEPLSRWPVHGGEPLSGCFLQLAAEDAANRSFVAGGGTPLILSRAPAALRPSQWLLDGEGYVVWRHLPDNYRTPGSVDLLRGQLSRLQD